MRKHARSNNSKIVRKLGDPESEKIGSTFFPFQGPAASMPSVGTRRSTCVFVPKTVSKVADGDLAARVLRSGKRLTLLWKPVGKKAAGDGDGDDDEWMRLFGSSGDTEDLRWWKGEKEGFGEKKRWHKSAEPKPEGGRVDEQPTNFVSNQGVPSHRGKSFGIVYSRKRRRSQSDGSSSDSRDKESKDWRYGIAFARKYRRKKPKVDAFETSRRALISDNGHEITEFARSSAYKVGILERDLWFRSMNQMVLVVLIESSSSASCYRFSCILVSILSGMRRTNVKLFDFAGFLLSKSIAGVFSLHGIHFLPVRHWKSIVSCRNASSDAGICTIFGARLFVPLVSLNFSALPFYFWSLHSRMFLGSLYLPVVLARYKNQLCTSASMDAIVEEDGLCDSTTGMDIILFESPSVKGAEVVQDDQVLPVNGATPVVEAPELASRYVATMHGVKFRKHQNKSCPRSARVPNRSLLKSRRNSLHNMPNDILKVRSAPKVRTLHESIVKPVCEKPPDACLGYFFSGTEEYSVSSPSLSNQKGRKPARKNPVEKIKELKSFLSEVKQNMDMVSCSANILVIELDRCRREEGAKVRLECTGSNEWCLAVKAGDTTRYLHKPQEMKPCGSNRYTHAIMWTGENGWRLEFCDRRDWIVFKELHKECCERNVQDVSLRIRIIPVPGVREVSGYEENLIASFVHPESYINTVNDEVERTLMSENAGYDMDSGDEEWLQQLNPSYLNGDSDGFSNISVDNFEKIICSFEKAAYSHPDDVSDPDAAVSLCLDLGKRDNLAAVFDYWMKKRKQKRSALIRVFQGQIPNRTQLAQKHFLRKKRSFKRQGSHAGRGKPVCFFEAMEMQEEIRRLQEAESAGNRAVEVAIQKRRRAQLLMTNADLVTYKSVMTSRLADCKAIRDSESPDLVSLILS